MRRASQVLRVLAQRYLRKARGWRGYWERGRATNVPGRFRELAIPLCKTRESVGGEYIGKQGK